MKITCRGLWVSLLKILSWDRPPVDPVGLYPMLPPSSSSSWELELEVGELVNEPFIMGSACLLGDLSCSWNWPARAGKGAGMLQVRSKGQWKSSVFTVADSTQPSDIIWEKALKEILRFIRSYIKGYKMSRVSNLSINRFIIVPINYSFFK